MNNVRFAQKNGNIVPVGPNELKEAEVLPLPYDLQEKRQRKEGDQFVNDQIQIEINKELRQVIPPPNQINDKFNDKHSSTNLPGIAQTNNMNLDVKKHTTVSVVRKKEYSAVIDEKNSPVQQTSEKVEKKLEKAQNNVDGIINQILRMIWRIRLIKTCNALSDIFLLQILWIIVFNIP